MDVTMVICLLALGAVAGFAAGLLGIGGGMLLVPFLTMLFAWKGMPADLVVHAAIATSMTSILFTSISSVRAHQQKGTIKWRIVWAMAPGIILGGLLSGGAVFAALSTLWLSLFFALFVGYSGWNMLRNKKPKPSRQMPGVVGTSAAGAGIGFLSGLVGRAAASCRCPSWSGATWRCTMRCRPRRRWVFPSRWPTASAMWCRG
ncbi:Sulfite exporter TauE/SafE [Achromobacter xylosoxidans]|nr:Sulfite exporter TauE/SafE [Achromobacter xylosoxidans]